MEDTRRERGSVIVLARSAHDEAQLLARSLELLRVHFLERWNYPVIVFTDGAFDDRWRELVVEESGVPVHWAAYVSAFPESVDGSAVPEFVELYSVDYRHMSRFFGVTMFRHPALQKYRWIARLDCDAHILGPVDYDPFQVLAEMDAVYGHLLELEEMQEQPWLTRGILECVDRYCSREGVAATFLSELRAEDGTWNLDVLHNRFEVLDMAWWREGPVQKFLRWIDNAGGIYHHGWTDYAIRTLALAVHAPRADVRLLDGIHYAHQEIEVAYCDSPGGGSP